MAAAAASPCLSRRRLQELVAVNNSYEEADDEFSEMEMNEAMADFFFLPELGVVGCSGGVDEGDMDEFDFLDNITSCNKVENCVMLSEYEQNLIKEKESPLSSSGARKWHR